MEDNRIALRPGQQRAAAMLLQAREAHFQQVGEINTALGELAQAFAGRQAGAGAVWDFELTAAGLGLVRVTPPGPPEAGGRQAGDAGGSATTNSGALPGEAG